MCENLDPPVARPAFRGVAAAATLSFALLGAPLLGAPLLIAGLAGSGASASVPLTADPPKLRFSLHPEPTGTDSTAPRWRAASKPEGSLLLPYYSLDVGDPNGAGGLLAVRNRSDQPHTVRLQYFDAATPPSGSPVFTQVEPLAPNQIRTVNLRFVGGLPTSGYVIATGVDADTLEPLDDASWLTGDYFRLDPGNDFASGDLLVGFSDGPDADALPDGLCNRWDHRFFSTGTFDGGTDFAFFVLENQTGGQRPVVTGDLYDEAGRFIVQIAIGFSGHAFEFNSSVLESPPLEIDAPFGAIQWTFADGAVGHVSTILKASARFSVGLAATCVDSID